MVLVGMGRALQALAAAKGRVNNKFDKLADRLASLVKIRLYIPEANRRTRFFLVTILTFHFKAQPGLIA
jgi:hypothetical protein